MYFSAPLPFVDRTLAIKHSCYSVTDKNAPIVLQCYYLDETELIVLHKLPLNCPSLIVVVKSQI